MARGIATDAFLHLLPNDKDGVSRTNTPIDAGCYQYVEYVAEEQD